MADLRKQMTEPSPAAGQGRGELTSMAGSYRRVLTTLATSKTEKSFV
jgi:hypothetical protein